MTETDAFIELLAAGVTPEDATELLDAIKREPRPIRPRPREADPIANQPVWALMNRPFGIVTGFRQMWASENYEDFDLNVWEASLM